jgi:hypothetical protein
LERRREGEEVEWGERDFGIEEWGTFGTAGDIEPEWHSMK